jgi:hypothetical protein
VKLVTTLQCVTGGVGKSIVGVGYNWYIGGRCYCK